MKSAITAAPRLTKDSRASDRSPTEPVSHHAIVFSTIVATAAAIESQAKRTSEPRVMRVRGRTRAPPYRLRSTFPTAWMIRATNASWSQAPSSIA